MFTQLETKPELKKMREHDSWVTLWFLSLQRGFIYKQFRESCNNKAILFKQEIMNIAIYLNYCNNKTFNVTLIF